MLDNKCLTGCDSESLCGEAHLAGNLGTFEEPLPCGGVLKVTKTSWGIFYYFPGPDFRYRGTFASIPGELVNDYIDALIENWADYQKIKPLVPKRGEFSKDARQGMSIRIGIAPDIDGVSVFGSHFPITTVEQLKKVVEGYRYAIQRAQELHGLLNHLSDSSEENK